MSYLNWPVSKIAAEVPGASNIFFQYKVNFCRDNEQTLAQALSQHNLEPTEFISELMALEPDISTTDWQALNNDKLIEQILLRFHQVHRQQLSELQALAQQVENVHSDHPLCPKGLAKHLHDIAIELEQHMQKEEMILFPMLAQNANAAVFGPISVMKAEHHDHFSEIEKIYQLCHTLLPHQGACNTWQSLYQGLQQFISDLNLHIHIENNILFKRAQC
ncbi:iron-sulfur cluster repair protein YtfE [Thalassotalea insulae]|uniref:Iron-sulfur cluster repair protein YtfE n=1 Tax=Thalassotalea insulae TaxID=2056778 RepID=A0ABQ6GX45_9GAMM|nr:DUF542 domain-containing protein [Thalassotalea insulae]GLX79216.1 iron-sulfur cluster repair protein YtfE [Thalassotalea insulae]